MDLLKPRAWESAIERELKSLNFDKLFTYFFVCAFIGWLFETVAVWVDFHALTARGYFFVMDPLRVYLPFLQDVPVLGNLPLIWGLPIIELYGFGGVIMVYFFRHFEKHPIKLFLMGMVAMTLFELISSYFCTFFLGRSFWSYTNEFLNFQGRICLRSSIAWGVLSLVAVRYLGPRLDHFYHNLEKKHYFKGLVIVLFLYTLFCAYTKYIVQPVYIGY